MPTEIALLPMIESAYNPTGLFAHAGSGDLAVHSRPQAASTACSRPGGTTAGATCSPPRGPRSIICRSCTTPSATGSSHWLRTTAARVNSSAPSTKTARKHKPTDYFSLKLPKETRNYLPKLQAVKNIIADPSLFALRLDAIPNRPYFAVVKAPPTIDVAMAAKLADMPVEEFRSLNPGAPAAGDHAGGQPQLLVPVDKAELFHANLESNDQPLVTWQTYQLKKGEKLEHVADKFGISPQRLKEVNGLTGRKRDPSRPDAPGADGRRRQRDQPGRDLQQPRLPGARRRLPRVVTIESSPATRYPPSPAATAPRRNRSSSGTACAATRCAPASA